MPERARIKFETSGRRTVAILMALGVLLLVFAIGIATQTMGEINADTDKVQATLERQTKIMRLATSNEQIAAGRRGFLLQPDPSFTKVVREATADYENEQADLREMLANEPEQMQMLEQIEQLNTQRVAIIDEMLSNPQQAFDNARIYDFNGDRGVKITQQIRDIAEGMANKEQVELASRNRNQLDSLIRFYVVGGIAMALLIGVMIGAVILLLRYNRDLTRAQIGLKQANEGLEAAVDERTAELRRANQEIQRFAYIVSHDLRSPLVNVLGFTSELDEARKTLRGYLEQLFEERPELRDEGAWLAVDEDLPEALGFIRSSTEKMDRLINSILELSRQGRRTLAPERLDMNMLVDGVVASLHQRAEDAGASVLVKPIPDVVSDRVAVEQILSNLVENALKYLSPDRKGEVIVQGMSQGKNVLIDVIDNGRGIDPNDHERVFDLFRRAGIQDQQGEGIGLANARALAYRLGGSLDVDSKLDEGARFRLTLPAKFVAAEVLA